jgi:hypothetical protein
MIFILCLRLTGTDYEMPVRYLNWYDGANLPGASQLTHLKNLHLPGMVETDSAGDDTSYAYFRIAPVLFLSDFRKPVVYFSIIGELRAL